MPKNKSKGEKTAKASDSSNKTVTDMPPKNKATRPERSVPEKRGIKDIVIKLALVLLTVSAALPLVYRLLFSTNSSNSNEQIPETFVTYGEIQKINLFLKKYVDDLTHNTDFFRYYRLNLYASECPFWQENEGYCLHDSCSVNTTEEENVPEIWKASRLGRLEGPKAKEPLIRGEECRGFVGRQLGRQAESCIVDYEEANSRDYCVLEDLDQVSDDLVYVSLLDNPERFTGYGGSDAARVWNFIYLENCFGSLSKESLETPNLDTIEPMQGFAHVMNNPKLAAMQKSSQTSLISPQSLERERLVLVKKIKEGECCLEQRVFYRVISGMHASISTHICRHSLNRKTGIWGPDYECFMSRVGRFPDRLENLYFNYVLMFRAVSKLSRLADQQVFCKDCRNRDKVTRTKLSNLVTLAEKLHPQPFDEKLMFDPKDPANLMLKKEFRLHFRNISAIMDCVQCDKCRLWGKIQTNGYGTALKILFDSDDDENFSLKRTELVALINTFARISSSVESIHFFSKLSRKSDTSKGYLLFHYIYSAFLAALTRAGDLFLSHTERLRSDFMHEWMAFTYALKLVIHSWISLPGDLLTFIWKFFVPDAQ